MNETQFLKDSANALFVRIKLSHRKHKFRSQNKCSKLVFFHYLVSVSITKVGNIMFVRSVTNDKNGKETKGETEGNPARCAGEGR